MSIKDISQVSDRLVRNRFIDTVVLIQGQAMLDEHYAVCRAIQAYVMR